MAWEDLSGRIMSDLNAVRAQRHKANEYKRHNAELNKAKTKHYQEYKAVVKKNENELTRIKSEYETTISNLQNDLEQKLFAAREKQKQILGQEHIRLNSEIEYLKAVQKDKVRELKESHENQIVEMNTSHEKTLDIAQKKFAKERAKYEEV